MHFKIMNYNYQTVIDWGWSGAKCCCCIHQDSVVDVYFSSALVLLVWCQEVLPVKYLLWQSYVVFLWNDNT